MLNEKIFVFLWFWYLFVATATGISFIYWFITSLSRAICKKIVASYLGRSIGSDQPLIDRFLKESLRPDGVFLIRLISFQSGDLVAAEITHALWNGFKERLSRRRSNEQITPSPSSLQTLPRYEKGVTPTPVTESSLWFVVTVTRPGSTVQYDLFQYECA